MELMLLREETIKRFQQKGHLLETMATDGLLMGMVQDMKGHFAEFGKLLGASAKLLLTDISALLTVVFGKTRSAAEYKELEKRFNDRRTGHWTNISSSTKALTNAFPEGQIVAMAMNPGAFLTSKLVSGDLFDIDAKGFFNEVGLTEVPIIKHITGSGAKSVFWSNVDNLDPNASPEEFDSQWRRIISIDQPRDTSRGGTTVFDQVNSVFVFDSKYYSNDIILEGDDEGKKTIIPEEVKEKLRPLVAKEINEWAEQQGYQKAYLEDRKEFFEPIIKEAEEVLVVINEVTTSDDPDSFFQAVEKLKDVGGEAAAKIDISQLPEKFKSSAEESWNELQSTKPKSEEPKSKKKSNYQAFVDKLVKSGDIPTEYSDEDVKEQFIKKSLLEIKSQFIVKMRGDLVEYYEFMENMVEENTDSQDQKIIAGTPAGKEFLKQVNDYKKRLENAINNIRG